MKLLITAASDVGRVRAGNEDAYLVDDDARLIAVADGMGGHQGGEVASATAINALRDGVQAGRSLDEAIGDANSAVYAKAADNVDLRGMGTTLTAAVYEAADGLLIGHVGDSRAYLLRDGTLRQVTEDHSVVAELIALGQLTEAEAETDPRRAMITRALGIEREVDVDVVPIELANGDRLLLCSDGLTTMVRDEAIAEVLRDEPDRQRAAEELVAAANAAGGADNITVVIADVVLDDDAPSADLPVAPAPAAPPDSPDDGSVDSTPANEFPAASSDRRHWWPRRRSA